jgi:Ribonuclease G/E
LLVQVVKEEGGNSAATIHFACPFSALMPGTFTAGQQKISNGSDRKRLKSIIPT